MMPPPQKDPRSFQMQKPSEPSHRSWRTNNSINLDSSHEPQESTAEISHSGIGEQYSPVAHLPRPKQGCWVLERHEGLQGVHWPPGQTEATNAHMKVFNLQGTNQHFQD